MTTIDTKIKSFYQPETDLADIEHHVARQKGFWPKKRVMCSDAHTAQTFKQLCHASSEVLEFQHASDEIIAITEDSLTELSDVAIILLDLAGSYGWFISPGGLRNPYGVNWESLGVAPHELNADFVALGLFNRLAEIMQKLRKTGRVDFGDIAIREMFFIINQYIAANSNGDIVDYVYEKTLKNMKRPNRYGIK